VLRRVLLLLGWLVSLGVAFVLGVLIHKHRDAIRARFRTFQEISVVATNLYDVRVRKLAFPAEGRDGALDALGDGVLVVNRRGKAWFINRQLSVVALPLTVPVNVAEFESDPFNRNTIAQDRFSVKDILVQRTAAGIRILASHLYWHSKERCNTLRVSVTESDSTRLLSTSSGPGTWRTAYESAPCRELIESPDKRSLHVTLGAGGRMAPLGNDRILLTVGEFSAEYSVEPGKDSVDAYGKTMLIDLAAGSATQFTRGHRNPQGLAVAPDGRIWETEHGARGGDELNLLVQGRHYGAPYVSLGTQYEMKVWPHGMTQGRHDGFEKPFFAWVPSIATSQLIIVRGSAFPWWTGDLLVGSLAARALHRVRVDEGRVILVEPIPLGYRIRDIAELTNGTIAIKTDEDFVLFLDNIESASPSELSPATRGAVVAGQCRSCHAMQAGAPAGIGPNLWGIVGRPVASAPGYAYSDAIRRVGGAWTSDRLRTFLADPGAFAPGNRMQATAGLSPQQLSDLLSYLETLR
jgi:glucose/arabinose dehydrogenase